jgi:hypothetical protein
MGIFGKLFGKPKPRDYDQTVAWLREHGFELLEPTGTSNRIFLKQHNCSAAIEKDEQGGVRLFAKPGYLVSGEISKLIDRGYQKFLKTSKAEVPATADHLRALHQFSQELKEALGSTSLYNESLGTVSDRYQYDRVEHRDEPVAARPAKAWEAEPVAATKLTGKPRS